MLIDEAKTVDLSVTSDDVRREAEEAEELAAELEELMERGAEDRTVSPAAVVEKRELFRFARRRVELTRERAERAAEARRLLALEVVAGDIDELAANVAADGAFAAAVRGVTDAVASLRELCATHDLKVEALIDRARSLNVEDLTAGGGPRPTSAHVALAMGGGWRRRGIRHGSVLVRVTSSDFEAALTHAVDGDADAATALLTT